MKGQAPERTELPNYSFTVNYWTYWLILDPELAVKTKPQPYPFTLFREWKKNKKSKKDCKQRLSMNETFQERKLMTEPEL